MTWFESVAAGLMASVVGIVSAAIVGFAAFYWFPFTGLEGAKWWYIALNALLGGLFGFLIGVIGARAWNAWGKPQWKAKTSVAHVGGGAGGVVLVIAVVTAFILWLLADIPPEIDGRRLNLEIELRMPTSEVTPPSEFTDPQLKLYSVIDRVKRAQVSGVLKSNESRKDDNDRWIIPGSVPVFTTRGQRLIEAQLGGDTIGSFTIPLPGRPGPENQKWSEWLPKPPPPPKPAPAGAAKALPAPGKAPTPPPPPPSALSALGKPAVPDTAAFRYRVVLIGAAPAAAKASATGQPKKENPVVAKFARPKAEATLPELLANTRLSATDADREAAIAAITAKPTFVDELSALMISEDNRVAADALYVIARLKEPPAALAPGVMAAGSDIAARLDKLNQSQGDIASQSTAASDLTIRFAAWMDAVRVMRRATKVDFIPQMVAILERSRVRTDNPMVQRDIRRVASRFAKDWGGVKPQAGDPPW